MLFRSTATATDGSNKFRSYTLIVKPKKTRKPRVSVSDRRSLYVEFDSQYGANGYQVQYATNKRFKNAKTKKVAGTSATLKKLKKNKKYYVRARAYVKKGKKIYPGSWSNVSSKKVR